MTKYLYLVVCLLLTTMTGSSVDGSESGWPQIEPQLVKVGLVLDGSGASRDDSTSDESQSCARVSFSRNLRYGESDLNILDVATGEVKETSPRPVLLFVAGESFAGDNGAPDVAGPLQDQAMCFAARHGMVGVKVAYRPAPANPWPAGAKDVAAAISWVHQNIDLFGGSPDEIVAVGYSAGASHVASLVAHRELQQVDSGVAGVVLVSGVYRSSADADAVEKSYFGEDAGKRSEIGISRHPQYRDADLARLVGGRFSAPRRSRREAERALVQLRDPLSAHDRAEESRKSRFGLWA